MSNPLIEAFMVSLWGFPKFELFSQVPTKPGLDVLDLKLTSGMIAAVPFGHDRNDTASILPILPELKGLHTHERNND